MDWWKLFLEWFTSLSKDYGVNPIIFGSLYLGAIPFFSLSLVWLIRNIKLGRPIWAPLFFAGLFFVSSYLYLIVVGRDIPLWVYLIIAGMIVLGVVSTWKRIRSRSGLR